MTTTEMPNSLVASELERLIALRNKGLLTNDEFEQAKNLSVGVVDPFEQVRQASQLVVDRIAGDDSVTEKPLPIDQKQVKETRSSDQMATKARKITAAKIVGDTSKYEAALIVGMLVSGIGWLIMIGGIVGAVVIIKGDFFSGVLGAIFVVVAVLGLVAIASGELIRAAVDVANNSAGLLALEKAKWDRANG